MKKIIAALIIISVMMLSGCSSVSMRELSAPLCESYSALLEVKTDGEPMAVSVIKDGGTMTLVVDEKYTFVCSDGKWVVSYSGLSVPLSSDAAKRSIPHKIVDALTVPDGAKWSITTTADGARALIKCENTQSGNAIYFDAETKLPARVTSAGLDATITKFDPAG